MMLSLIWIDRQQARLFHISNDKMERKQIKLHHTDHHTHRRDHADQAREEPNLFRNVAAELGSSERFLVIGPGVAKHHFLNFLTEHYPALAKRVAGIETVDHPTDGQIAALAKRFFEKASA